MMRLVGEIRERGVTVLLVEHDMRMVMAISDTVVVLNHGRIIAEGPPGVIQAHPEVIQRLPRPGAQACSRVDGITVRYGRCRRCTASRSTVERGELVTLIGANGAGKTTTLRAISGLLPLSGRAASLFEGEDDHARAGAARSWRSASPIARKDGTCSRTCPCARTSSMGCYLRRDAAPA